VNRCPLALLLLLLQTVKYLYLSFVDSGSLLDYYVLSTEGHIMPSHSNPVDAHVEEDDYLVVCLGGGGGINFICIITAWRGCRQHRRHRHSSLDPVLNAS
jgi:hypothetical protein